MIRLRSKRSLRRIEAALRGNFDRNDDESDSTKPADVVKQQTSRQTVDLASSSKQHRRQLDRSSRLTTSSRRTPQLKNEEQDCDAHGRPSSSEKLGTQRRGFGNI